METARENKNYGKRDSLKYEAVKYVNDIETAKKFKEIFPELRQFDKSANKIYQKLKNNLNWDELIELKNTYSNQKFDNIDVLILEKTENISQVVKTIDEFPDLKLYYPEKVTTTAYQFVNDKNTARKFMNEFPESDKKYLDNAKDYIENDKTIDTKSPNTQKKDKPTQSNNINGSNNSSNNDTNNYNNLSEIESAINSNEISAKDIKVDALKYVDDIQTAQKYKDLFYTDLNDSDVSKIINELADKLDRSEIYQLTNIFAEFNSVSKAINLYIEKSSNLSEVIKASDQFKDKKYQDKAFEEGLKYVNDITSALKYKNNFLEELNSNDSYSRIKLKNILDSELKDIKSFDESIQIINDFSDVYNLSSFLDKIKYKVRTKESLEAVIGYYDNIDRYIIEDLLDNFNKTELLRVAKEFKNDRIMNTARRLFVDRSYSLEDYKIIINNFPHYKEITKKKVLNSITDLNKAVEVKNVIPSLSNELSNIVVKNVNDFDSALLFKKEFSLENKKEMIVKKLIKILNNNDLRILLEKYNINEDEDIIIEYNQRYKNLKKEYVNLYNKNPRFQVQGEIEDRTEKKIYIRGLALPLNSSRNAYGALYEKGNIVVINYSQNNIHYNNFVSQELYFKERVEGQGIFGQKVPVWIFGDKPKDLKEAERDLDEIILKIDQLEIN